VESGKNHVGSCCPGKSGWFLIHTGTQIPGARWPEQLIFYGGA